MFNDRYTYNIYNKIYEFIKINDTKLGIKLNLQQPNQEPNKSQTQFETCLVVFQCIIFTYL